MKLLNKQSLVLLCLSYHILATIAQANVPDDSKQPPDLTTEVEFTVQSGEPIRVQRFDHQQANIKIDGYLKEPAWKNLQTFDRMKVSRPDTLATPPYKSEFRIFYTEKGIYASYDLEQPQDTIVKRFAVRDEKDLNRDTVSFALDTSGNGRYGYWISISIGDVQRDGSILPEREFNSKWDGAWYGATQLTDRGWSAEFFLPWSQVAMPKQQGIRRIGLYITRLVSHLDEEWSWPALPESQPLFLSNLQPLEITAIDPKKQWSFFPFTSSTYDRIDNDVRYKAGFDVFWRPSSNLQLTATTNPDFGSVEMDDVIVNFTANETFFPEKRLFFQEGQDIFNTTSRSEAHHGQKMTVVNTRRIGARPRPPTLPSDVSLSTREEIQPSDLLGAIKMTGQLGTFRYGILAAIEDESKFVAEDRLFFQDGRDFGALRVLYEDKHRAAYRGLGFISTIVAHPETDATVHGIDFHRLSTNGIWNIEGQFLYSNLDKTDSGIGGFTDIEYRPRQGVKHTFKLTTFDDKLDFNDLGFQIRNDITEVQYSRERVISNLTRIRDLRATGFVRYAENGEGFRINTNVGGYLDLTLNNLHSVGTYLKFSPDRFDDRSSFGNGTFKTEGERSINVWYRTNPAKSIYTSINAQYLTEAIGGYSVKVKTEIEWRPKHNITLNLEASYRDRNNWLLHQEGRNFTTFNGGQWEPKFSLDYFPSAKQRFRVILHWAGIRAYEDEFYMLPEESTNLIAGPKPLGLTDNFNISQLNFQIRYRWQIAPMSDLFIVYTKADSRKMSDDKFEALFRNSWNMPLGDQLVVKLRYRIGS